ncbi:MAG TPA: DUF6404 family protein [Gemmata sp.]
MPEREKIDAAVAFLKTRQVSDSTAVPPLWRLCWRAGFLVPPPHFLGFLTLALFTGLPFGIVLNLLVAGFLLITGKPLAWPFATVGISGALMFGLFLAGYYRWSAVRLGLPSWSEFRPDFDGSEESW